MTYLPINSVTYASGEAAAEVSVGLQNSIAGYQSAPVTLTPLYLGAFLSSVKRRVRLTRRSVSVSIILERAIKPIS